MSKPVYLDPSYSVDERVSDLLNRMSLEEKVAQLQAVWATELLDGRRFSEEKASKYLKDGIGQITRVAGNSLRLSPREVAMIINEIQRYLVDKTRLHIPALIHEECLSGFMAHTATSFPQFIGLASSWDPELMFKIGNAIREQMRVVGVHQGLAPVLDIALDPRYGRTEETLGEDPYLVARLGVEYIKGIQTSNPRNGIIATAKHYAAHGFPEGGRNKATVHATPRMLREVFLYPFEAAMREAGVLSVMPAYHDIDGIPCHINSYLLHEVLRKELGFKGIAVSDYFALNELIEIHGVARDCKESATKAIVAGVDIELPHVNCFGEPLIQAVKEGLISEKIIDEAVKRVLRLKFILGLFENPYVDLDKVPENLDDPKYRSLALEAARKSIVLLKNDGILPLPKNVDSIAVIGPNANSKRNLLGDYTYTAHLGFGEDEVSVNVVTVLEGIKRKLSPGTRVYYAKGCDIATEDRSGFTEAIEIASKSDVVIMAIGEKSGLYYEWLESWGKKVKFEDVQHVSGEANDSHNLKLPGVQEELIKEIYERTKKPIILVLVNGRPLDLSNVINHVSAIVEAWYPGEEGGTAIADILFGDYNPNGKLPISWPKHVGQLPVYYYRRRHSWKDYVFLDSKPLFPFGYGLSYSEYIYESISVEPKQVNPNEVVRITVTIKNVGKVPGEEVVQLYISREYSSISRPEKELKSFTRIHLKPSETKKIVFELPVELLAIYDERLNLVVESGKYNVLVGSSSEDIRLRDSFTVIKPLELKQRTAFFSNTYIV